MKRPVGWVNDSTRYHRLNVVSCELVARLTWTSLIGVYLTLLMLEHLPNLEESLKRFRYPIVLREMNVDLNKSRIPQSQQMADLLRDYGLI